MRRPADLPAIALIVALSVSVAACGGGSDAGSSARTDGASVDSTADAGASVAGADAQAGPAVAEIKAPAAFNQCRACHSVKPGQHGVGPSLAGLFGTKAGDIPGYTFSDALKGSGLTWDEETLDKWLAGPARLVPGTKMVYPGQPDPAKRKELIEYMKALK